MKVFGISGILINNLNKFLSIEGYELTDLICISCVKAFNKRQKPGMFSQLTSCVDSLFDKI